MWHVINNNKGCVDGVKILLVIHTAQGYSRHQYDIGNWPSGQLIVLSSDTGNFIGLRNAASELTLSRFNLFHPLTLYFSKIYFNVICLSE
jgi:hypothetical protein